MTRVLAYILCSLAIVAALFSIGYCIVPTTEAASEVPTVVTEVTEETTIAEETEATEVTQPTEENEVTEPTDVTDVTEPVISYSEKDLEYLAIAIYQEAGGDNFSDETRLMVGTVIMNRVADPRFPDDLYGVLTQKSQYGLLHWTGMVWASRAKNPGEQHAVKRAYECAEQILMGYRSFDEDVIWQAEFIQGTEVVAHQEGMYFCR